MGPRGGIQGLLDTLYEVLGIHPAPWIPPLVVLVGALIFLPFILRNQNTGKARRVLGRIATATTATERAAIEAEALALVDGNPDGLAALADAALGRGRSDLARTCLQRLQTLGGRPAEVRRLTRALDGDGPASVEEAIVRVERQREAGLVVAAAETLARAEARWPDHPELTRLRSAGSDTLGG